MWIEWIEPFGPNAEPCYIRVKREVAIAHQKEKVKQFRPEFKYESDEDALYDFMVINWATEIEEDT